MASFQSIRERLLHAIRTDPNAQNNNIATEIQGNKFWIRFNRPTRYNAFSPDMYPSFNNLISYANENPEIKFIIVTGNGGNYSSGNDLSNFGNPHYINVGTREQLAAANAENLREFCDSIINSKKPIFGLVQGKAIGFAFTQLALFDRVYAVEGAQFSAPLVKLAQGPQMCASYLFPKIFGDKVATDLVIIGKKVDCKFLQKYNFIQSFISKEAALKALDSHLNDIDELQWNSYLQARRLFRKQDTQILLRINKQECDNLVQRWINPELPAFLVEYMRKIKSKSKL